MNILIADDSPNRYNRLVEGAEAIGISKSCFQFSGSISEIRTALNSEPPLDLMVLDLLLPNWPSDSEQNTHHTMDLLRELIEDDVMNKPRKIIGITGDKSLHEKYYSEFSRYAWTLLSYDPSESEWSDCLLSSLKYVKQMKAQEPEAGYDVDLAIVCALLDPELNAILELPWSWEAPAPMDQSTFYRRGRFLVDGLERSVIAVSQPRMGMVAAATLTTKVISCFRPRVVVMPGICAGIENEVSIGDVIFAETAWDYQSGKFSTNGDERVFDIDPDQIFAYSSAAAAIKLLTQETTKLFNIASNYGSSPIVTPSLHVAPVASGSAVVADEEEAIKIKRASRKVKGLEMEIYGVYGAVRYSVEPRPNVYAMKAVCDLANSKKNDNHQKFAAYMSARVLELAILEYPDMMLGSRKRQ